MALPEGEETVVARPLSRAGCKTPLLTPRCQRKARINFRQRAAKLHTPERSLSRMGKEKPPVPVHPEAQTATTQNSNNENISGSMNNQTNVEHCSAIAPEEDSKKLVESNGFSLKRPSQFMKK